MADSDLFRGFYEYQRRQNIQKSSSNKLEPKSAVLRHIRRHVKCDSITEFGEKVGIEPMRLLLTEICADPKTFEVLSPADFIQMAEVCEFNIGIWLEQLSH